MKLAYLIGVLGVTSMFGGIAHGSGGNIGSRSVSPSGMDIKWETAGQAKGSCLYAAGYGSPCRENVTKAWCDDRRGSWREGSSCP